MQQCKTSQTRRVALPHTETAQKPRTIQCMIEVKYLKTSRTKYLFSFSLIGNIVFSSHPGMCMQKQKSLISCSLESQITSIIPNTRPKNIDASLQRFRVVACISRNAKLYSTSKVFLERRALERLHKFDVF